MPKLIPYKRFTTGLTYREVAAMVWSYDDDNRTWLNGSVKTTTGPDGKKKWNRRRLILGKWHEIKLEMYAHYLHEMTYDPDPTEPFEDLDDLDPVPF